VVSEETAKLLTDVFEGVVERGTGKLAKIDKIRIAGKTGTSRKLVNGQYSVMDHTASFVGYFPVEDPQILCLVMMDIPGGILYTGGATSAPVFRAIAEQVITSTDYLTPARPASDSLAGKAVMAGGLPAMPSPKKPVPRQARPTFNGPVVPDVKGYSVRKAVGILTAEKYQPFVKGSGIVTDQEPPAGQPAKAGMRVVLTCQPTVTPSLGAR
jgi:cell division protein FtsI (penicillin-binding protein 3)